MDVSVTWAPFDYSLLGMPRLFIYFSQWLTYFFFFGKLLFFALNYIYRDSKNKGLSPLRTVLPYPSNSSPTIKFL